VARPVAARFAPDSLLLREGCTVALERAPDGAFVGGTVGTGCRSSLRGAAYATSEVRIDPDGIESWDRGFDPHGNQVWGATAGPYVFRRMAELAEEMPPLPPPPPAPRAPAPTSPAPKKGDG
jgi:hypothetical protein